MTVPVRVEAVPIPITATLLEVMLALVLNVQRAVLRVADPEGRGGDAGRGAGERDLRTDAVNGQRPCTVVARGGGR